MTTVSIESIKKLKILLMKLKNYNMKLFFNVPNALLILTAIFLTSCGSTTKLQQENELLKSKTGTLQAELAQLNSEQNMQKTKLEKLEKLELSNKKQAADLSKCKNELDNCNNGLNFSQKEYAKLSNFFTDYRASLIQLKAELRAAFPNNLNDVNFSIREEDGRLIVTIPNTILYEKGKANFNINGQLAIQKLTPVLKKHKDLQILVEGHTDDTPLKPDSQYADNWDLSVARAVFIVRKFESNGIHPQRLTAAGRGSFMPISRLDDEESKLKNRRTEIIIRPKIKELLKLMNAMEM